MAGPDKRRQVLSWWDPGSGETGAILDERGEPLVGYGADVPARAPGLLLVHVYGDRNNPTLGWLVMLDVATLRATRVPGAHHESRIVCLEGADAVVLLTPRNRVVRHRLSDGTAEALFPR
jgi:hypothetical protein